MSSFLLHCHPLKLSSISVERFEIQTLSSFSPSLDYGEEFDNLSHNTVKKTLIFIFKCFQPVADPPSVLYQLITVVELFAVHLAMRSHHRQVAILVAVDKLDCFG